MADADAMVDQYRRELDEGKSQAKQSLGLIGNKHTVDWSKYTHADWNEAVPTGVRIEQLRELAAKLTTPPSNSRCIGRSPASCRIARRWRPGSFRSTGASPRTLAYATLLTEGFEVRLTGQDSGRGTFFHRHAVWHAQNRGETYIPLKNLAPSQPRFTVIDSLLSEEGDGLRVRLLDHRAELPDDLGSAVRRFRQRRAGHHRPVHQLGRSEVGPCAA